MFNFNLFKLNNLKILLSIGLIALGSIEANAFRFGPRLGLYTESFKNACFSSKEFGLQGLLLFEKSPDKTCTGANRPVEEKIAASPCGCGVAEPACQAGCFQQPMQAQPVQMQMQAQPQMPACINCNFNTPAPYYDQYTGYYGYNSQYPSYQPIQSAPQQLQSSVATPQYEEYDYYDEYENENEIYKPYYRSSSGRAFNLR